MLRNKCLLGCVGLVFAAAALSIVGCKSEEETGAVDMSKYKVALASLSPDDRALAEKQAICPVSGEPLGSMGAPRKITVEGHDVFICCDGCEAELKDNPDEYLTKLGIH